MPEGLDEILANIHKLQVQNKRVAREAVTEVADKTAQILEVNTPVDGGEMQGDVATSGFKGGAQGQIEKDMVANFGTLVTILNSWPLLHFMAMTSSLVIYPVAKFLTSLSF
ncbi:hypothetical protein [Enterococcus sp. DIV1368d]|uniref:hypothetical protein n=1 Tax=Enterococcus sp. DIV1368d TaxID=2774736 RepID=UPI003D300268